MYIHYYILLLYLCFSSYVSLMLLRVAQCTFRHEKCRYRVSCFWLNVPRIWAEFIYHRCCIWNLKNKQFIFSKVLLYISVLRSNKDWRTEDIKHGASPIKFAASGFSKNWIVLTVWCPSGRSGANQSHRPNIKQPHSMVLPPTSAVFEGQTRRFFTLLNLP